MARGIPYHNFIPNNKKLPIPWITGGHSENDLYLGYPKK
jgi:hypothetical protein